MWEPNGTSSFIWFFLFAYVLLAQYASCTFKLEVFDRPDFPLRPQPETSCDPAKDFHYLLDNCHSDCQSGHGRHWKPGAGGQADKTIPGKTARNC